MCQIFLNNLVLVMAFCLAYALIEDILEEFIPGRREHCKVESKGSLYGIQMIFTSGAARWSINAVFIFFFCSKPM